MDFSKVNFEMLNWWSENNGYWPLFGHYVIVPNKKIRKTKLSFNCWLKKNKFKNEQINMIIRLKKNTFELNLFDYKGKYICSANYLEVSETNPTQVKRVPKIELEDLKIIRKQIVLTHRFFSFSIYIHFIDSKHQELKEKERVRHFPSKKQK